MNEPGPPRLKIIYILGSTQSGSTILDMAIGTATSAVSTGELGHIFWAFEAAREGSSSVTVPNCSCGLLVTQCPLWSVIWAEMAARGNLREFEEENRRFETTALSVPTAVAARLAHSRAFARHLDELGSMLRSVARNASAGIIVDSTKDPGRGWLYSLLPTQEFDVRFIHMVRDGRSVLSSMMVTSQPDRFDSAPSPWPPPAAALFSTLHWIYMNLHASILGRANRDRYLRIRYEDLVGHPVEMLESIEAFAEIDLSESRKRVTAGKPLSSGHLLCGNRSKTTPTLKVQASGRSRSSLSRGPELIFLLLAGWLQWYYLRPSVPKGSTGLRTQKARRNLTSSHFEGEKRS